MDNSPQPLFQLPTVRLPPFGELVATARNCEQLQLVRRLAKWTGNRRVTKTGHLLLADARAAARFLGLPNHPEARTSTAFPELNTLWSTAIAMRLIQDAPDSAPFTDDDVNIIELWIDLLAQTLQRLNPTDTPLLLPLLMRLHVDTHGNTPKSLAQHATTASHQLNLNASTPDPAEAPPGTAVVPSEVTALVRDLLTSLSEIDALVMDGDLTRLTDLGRFGLVYWFESEGIGAPYVMDLADATVAQVLDLGLTHDSAFDEWLAAVPPDVAAERILDHARGGTPTHRVDAFGMLDRVGPRPVDGRIADPPAVGGRIAGPVTVAEKLVRACLDDPDLRPHANAWLSGHGLPAGESTLDDLHRVFIDMVAADLHTDPRPARETIHDLAATVAYDAPALFENLWRCNHPDTLPVLQALAAHYPDPQAAKAARKGVLHLTSTTATPSD